jgi:N-acetylglucosaminyldiphosphoundecaprenol N-acetyl-beta-D-mannosaminyltransferase
MNRRPLVRRAAAEWPVKHPIFGVDVSATTCDELADAILRAARERRPACVTALAVHGLITAADDPDYHGMLDAFEALAPDGQPVRFALNVLHGAGLRDRVRAVDLTLMVCERAVREQVKIYLFGSRVDVVEALRNVLVRRFEGIEIVGCEPGVYRQLTPDEDAGLVERINGSGAGLLLVGLGCPYQEAFAYRHRMQIDAVQMCIGGVFDIISGRKRNAPRWMQRAGLEWLFRLIQEPRRLSRRYLDTNTRFIVKFCRAVVRHRRERAR